jgi:hypothetical protein
MIIVQKKENETSGSLFFRFTKRMRQSGLMTELRKRRFKTRNQNKRKILLSALYRAGKAAALKRAKRLGTA